MNNRLELLVLRWNRQRLDLDELRSMCGPPLGLA